MYVPEKFCLESLQPMTGLFITNLLLQFYVFPGFKHFLFCETWWKLQAPNLIAVGWFFFHRNTRKGSTGICINLLSWFVYTTLFWSHLSILSIHDIFFEKQTLLLSFVFSVCTFLMRQNKEVEVKLLPSFDMYLWEVLGALQGKHHFKCCAFMGKAKRCPYDSLDSH